MMPETIARKLNVQPSEFFATGVSLVIHPRSPMIPTVHANFRYFERADGDAWFGGGSDLTPYYPFDEDIVHFHTTLKKACDRHGLELYPKFKQWCDEYFFIKHRDEARGIGGVFFDYLRGDQEKHFAMVHSIGDVFLDAYLPLVKRRMHEPWGGAEREWQLIRRGRYVEFNLLYDRGTTFGLETNGRTEAILMSLPPAVQWRYDASPPGPREARLIELLKHPKEWVA
jgi:coproporphyrinogen III oxidase